MATRFYMPNTGSPGISPAYSGHWNFTAPLRRVLSLTRLGTAMGNLSVGKQVPFAGDIAMMQLISAPLQAQSIAGTVKAQILAAESAALADMRAQMTARIVSSDGSVERGVLLALDAGALASEFGATLQNRKFPVAWAPPGTALSNVDALADDRLVVEIGYRAHNGLLPASGIIKLGDDAADDLPEDETETLPLNPWIEFSQDLLFQGGGGGGAIAAVAAHHLKQMRG